MCHSIAKKIKHDVKLQQVPTFLYYKGHTHTLPTSGRRQKKVEQQPRSGLG